MIRWPKESCWIDTHAHLDLLEERGFPAEEIIEKANQAGIGLVLSVNTHPNLFPHLLALTQRIQGICSAGLHPCSVTEEIAPAHLKQWLIDQVENHDCVVALGETGIDLYHTQETFLFQEKAFHAHCQAALACGVPVIVHTRSSAEPTLNVLRQYAGLKVILHSFTETGMAEEALSRGYYLSFSGIVTFPKTESLRSIAQQAPERQILIETDAPYLAPVPQRGQVNQPAYVVHTGLFLANLRQQDPDSLQKALFQNVQSLLNAKN